MSSMSNPRILVVPIAYWLGTRLPKLGERMQYAGAVLGPQVLWLGLQSQGDQLVWAFVLGFAAMICVYELGYIANDHWAQRRERAAGIALRKEVPAAVSRWIFLMAIGGRAVVVTALVVLMGSLWGGVVLMSGYLAALLVVFMLHNLVLTGARVGSFFMLYTLRLSLPLIVVLVVLQDPRPVALWAWTLYAILMSVGFTLTYGMKKRYIPAPLFLSRMGGIELPLLLGSVSALGIGLISFLMGHDTFAGTLGALALWHLVYWTSWSTLRFAAELRAGLRRARTVLSHCHTDYSHDGSIPIEAYRAWLDEDSDRIVFLTDHAEDFDAARLMRLRADYASLTPRINVGLEFPVARQHILAHNLEQFFDTRDMPTEKAMTELRTLAGPIIWAHPRFSIRALLRPGYVTELLTLLALSDGIEFFNPKNLRRKRYRVMMVAMAWLGGALYGRRLLYLGVDAHSSVDLPALGTWRTRRTLDK